MRLEWDRHQVISVVAPVLVAVAFNVLRFHYDWEAPAWANWVCIALIAAVGLVVTMSPNGTPYLRPALARAAGVAIILIAVSSAYLQISSN